MKCVSSDSIVLFMYFANLKSGLGSCIAPKAGIARDPEKGMCGAIVSELCLGTLVSCCPGPGNSWGQPSCSAGQQRCRESNQSGSIGFYWSSSPPHPTPPHLFNATQCRRLQRGIAPRSRSGFPLVRFCLKN